LAVALWVFSLYFLVTVNAPQYSPAPYCACGASHRISRLFRPHTQASVLLPLLPVRVEVLCYFPTFKISSCLCRAQEPKPSTWFCHPY
jgi:hypothetical protein